MPRKLTKEEFIAKARAVHGSKYDYSETVYLPMPQKIAIRCPEHGMFMQKAGQHISGKGCPTCGGIIQKSKIQALGFANTKWDTASVRLRLAELTPALDFSEFEYLGNSIRSKVTCPVHGSMLWTPHMALTGRGCKKCFHANAGSAPRTNRQHQIERFQIAHGSKYDYSLSSDPLKADDKMPIRCPEHGVFHQSPTQHAAGQGCPVCGRVKGAKSCAKGWGYFVAKFKAAHNEKYDYSEVSLDFRIKDKIPIRCPEHGVFMQVADSHLRGNGCPKCGRKKLSATTMGKAFGWGAKQWLERVKGKKAVLYLLKITGHGECFFKIGITVNGVAKRFSGKSNMPYDYVIISIYGPGEPSDIIEAEKKLKRKFINKKHRPALAFPGRSECYADTSGIDCAFPL